jgi:hypothetical protein
MKIPTSILSAGLLVALVLPAANAAPTGRAAPHAIPDGSGVLYLGGALRPAIGSAAIAKASTAAKPKPIVRPKSKPRTGSLPGQVILPFVKLAVSESGPGYVENCASYLGCTDEEYCQTWGMRCDLLDAPVGARAARSSQGSDT